MIRWLGLAPLVRRASYETTWFKFIKINATNKTIYNKNSYKFSQGTTWFKKSLAHSYFNLCFWALDLENRRIFQMLWTRILKYYDSQSKRKNLRFVYSYLKECYHIIQFAQAGKRYIPKIWVSVDSRGLPKIIPSDLRLVILSDRKVLTGVCTLLGVHRVIPWWPKVDLSTILDPFSGISEVISPALINVGRSALSTVVKGRFFIEPARFFNISSASPNGKVSMLTVLEDASAFYYNPGYFAIIIKYLLFTRSYKVLASLIITVLVSWPKAIPFWIGVRDLSVPMTPGIPGMTGITLCRIFNYIISFCYFDRIGHSLGKLSVVYSVAGKARVIGVTNFWIQIALRPVHDSIFRILKQLPTDGTFNQEGAIKHLLDQDVSSFTSYDLSAATDRLPLKFQGQVIASLFGEKFSSLWVSMMQIPMVSFNGDTIKYAVGQPMGAYSSWASLAISHHYLIWIANGGFTLKYAVLGDDAAMDKSIGPRYKTLMDSLGVSISEMKSIVDSTFIEFAKKLISHCGDDFSILGPGAITASVQNPVLKPMLVYESYKRNFLTARIASSKLLSSFGDKPNVLSFGLQQLFGPKGLISKDPVIAPYGGKVGGLYMKHIPDSYGEMITKGAYMQLIIKRHKKTVIDSERLLWTIPKSLWESLSGNLSPMKVYYFISLWLSPVPYILFSTYWKVYKSKLDHSNLKTWDGIFEELSDLHVQDMTKLTRKDVKAIARSLREVQTYIERDLEELSFEVTPEGSYQVY